MRFKIVLAVSLFVLFSSCNNSANHSTEEVEKAYNPDITSQDIEKLKYTEYALDEKTHLALADWSQYIELEEVITKVKKGDLSFFNDNEKAINILSRDFKKNIPETVDSPSILARILVFETKLYKLESLSNLSTTSKEELLETIKEFLISFSNLNLQMNKKIEFDSRDIVRP
jgi:hypothetical protein